MRHSNKVALRLEALEDRTQPSFLGMFSHAAVQVDLMKVRADLQKLQSDATALAPTLQKDALAIQSAITTSTAAQAAKTTFNSDLSAWLNTFRTDWQAFASATDAASRDA